GCAIDRAGIERDRLGANACDGCKNLRIGAIADLDQDVTSLLACHGCSYSASVMALRRKTPCVVRPSPDRKTSVNCAKMNTRRRSATASAALCKQPRNAAITSSASARPPYRDQTCSVTACSSASRSLASIGLDSTRPMAPYRNLTSGCG